MSEELRKTIMDAMRSVSERADEFKAGCATFDGEWPDAEDKAIYDAEVELVDRLRVALTAISDAGQAPEPDCWAILTPNGSRLVSPEEAKGRRDAYPLYAAPVAAHAPQGWKVVPLEPTAEMIAGFWGEIRHGEPERQAAKEAYAEMLAAAPVAPQAAGDAAQAEEPTRYFVYDHEGGYNEFKTDSERETGHQAAIDAYLDTDCDGWSEEVAQVVSGIVTHKTVKTNEEHKPAPCAQHPEHDDENCDDCAAWNEWPNHDFETCCQYEPALIAAPVAPDAKAPTADQLYDAIEGILLTHKISNWIDQYQSPIGLVDRLCDHDAHDIESGQHQIRLICDVIYNELLTKHFASNSIAPTPTGAADAAAPTHADDTAVDEFAAVMKEKLAQARAKGRGGWETCNPADLSRMLREHVEKGDPRDVANFCMFLWFHRSPITSTQPDARAAFCAQCGMDADPRCACSAGRAARAAAPQATVMGDAPFSNCSFRHCDLPGQCKAEGACHHPAHAAVPQAVPIIEELSQDSRDFKNFHRSLCERFGYVHDESDWKRDQLSLIECIANWRDQFEYLDVQNHTARVAMRKIMARLAELLDEDRFAEIEEIVRNAGVEPPPPSPSVSAQPDARAAFEAWAMGEFELAGLPARAGLGYKLTGVDDSWAGWQAAWKARATAPQGGSLTDEQIVQAWKNACKRDDVGDNHECAVAMVRALLAAHPTEQAGK